VPVFPLFVFEYAPYAAWAAPLAGRLPPLAGHLVRIARKSGLRDVHGAVHASAFLHDRKILFDCHRREFTRVFVHEIFHFVWLRLGNAQRWSYEDLLGDEFAAQAQGELGWSAEWRKNALTGGDRPNRTRRWREYCCESFCDSAAWLYSGRKNHDEFTLPLQFRSFRQDWFTGIAKDGPLPI